MSQLHSFLYIFFFCILSVFSHKSVLILYNSYYVIVPLSMFCIVSYIFLTSEDGCFKGGSICTIIPSLGNFHSILALVILFLASPPFPHRAATYHSQGLKLAYQLTEFHHAHVPPPIRVNVSKRDPAWVTAQPIRTRELIPAQAGEAASILPTSSFSL